MNNNSLTKRDIFFAFIITCFVIGGIQQIYASQKPGNSNASLAPSFLLGAGASLITQWWLGGINSEDEVSIKNKLLLIKIGSGAAVLMGSTLIFQYLIDHNSKSLTLKPPKESLTVFDDKGDGRTLTITGTNIKPESITVDKDHLKKIADKCREGKGFCTTRTYDVLIRVSPHLIPGNAEICNDELEGFRLSLLTESTNRDPLKLDAYSPPTPLVGTCNNSDKGSKSFINVLKKSFSKNNSPLEMWISVEDSKKLYLNSTKVPVPGTVSIVPQKEDKRPLSGIEK